MAEITWVAGPNSDTLQAEGRPITIRKTGSEPPFVVNIEGRAPFWTHSLKDGMSKAEWKADEMDEFASYFAQADPSAA